MRRISKLVLLLLLINTTKLVAVDFKINFYDKKVYYPDSDIYLKGSIFNNENGAYFFRAADNHAFNLDVSVYTLTKQSLKVSEEYIKLQNSNKPYFYRDVSLEPQEEYGFTFNLRDFVDITESGTFVVEVKYYSDMSRKVALTSNSIFLVVRARNNLAEYRTSIDIETNRILSQENLPPDEVIDYTVSALIQQNWNKFFLYFDLKGLLLQNKFYSRRYNNTSETGQFKMLENYRRSLELREIPVEAALTDIPASYQILRTSYVSNEAEVIVLEKFKRNGYFEWVHYTYYLNRSDNNIWKIHRYETEFLRSE